MKKKRCKIYSALLCENNIYQGVFLFKDRVAALEYKVKAEKNEGFKVIVGRAMFLGVEEE